MTEPKRTRLTDMEFDEISFVDNPAHPDARVVLFKRHIEDPGIEEISKPVHPSTGPTSSAVHVDRISSHNRPKKKKKRKRQEEVEEMMEKGSGDPSLYASGPTKKKRKKRVVAGQKTLPSF